MDFNLKLSEGQVTLVQQAIKHIAEQTMATISDQVGAHLANLADEAAKQQEKPSEKPKGK